MPRPRLEAALWWPELMALKDTLSLRDLSERFHVSVNGLSRALKRAGSPKADSALPGGRRTLPPLAQASAARVASPVAKGAEGQSWWDEFMRLKDQHTLVDLAERFGVAEITLQRAMKRAGVQRRSQRGVRGSRKPPARAPAGVPTRVRAAPSPLPPGRDAAFLVRLRAGDRERRGVVVAPELSAVVQLVTSRILAGDERLDAIEYLGPIL